MGNIKRWFCSQSPKHIEFWEKTLRKSKKEVEKIISVMSEVAQKMRIFDAKNLRGLKEWKTIRN